MIPQPLDQSDQRQQPVLTPERLIAEMQWVDQYNQHLVLTVQALRHLQVAFDGKFSR